ncbi:MAG: MotA/TolQ/ExbB proton channel family protein [Planctomycetes bacterium]|nr:MotA/TolQ/ExbB proton channel family protein [Planctomycetota bacterium]
MWDFISRGGFFIYPLLLCSILALGIIIERFFTLYLTRKKLISFLKNLNEIVKKGSLAEAIEACEKSGLNLALIYKSGLAALKKQKSQRRSTTGDPKEQVKTALQESAALELPSLEKNLGILSNIAHIAPLLGFLGTVTGMINAFQRIQEMANVGQGTGPGDLAGGIWEALLTTAIGLVIAIPTYVAYAYFRSVVTKTIGLMERNAVELVEQLTD